VSRDPYLATLARPSPVFFVSVASKEFGFAVSGLESTLVGCLIGVDSKRLRGDILVPTGTAGKIGTGTWRA